MELLLSPTLYHLLLPWLLCLPIVLTCTSDRSQEKGHLTKRQALKRKQREAMLARKEVNSVVNDLDERPTVTPNCTRLTCVRNMPDASTESGEMADVYRRLEEDGSSQSTSDREKKKRQELEVEKTQDSSPEKPKKSKSSMSSSKKSCSIQIDPRIDDI